MQFEDELTKAIMRKFAPDFATALHAAPAMEVYASMHSVSVALRADVRVAYDKGLAAFIVRGTIRDVDPEKWLRGETIFSTRELISAHDKVAVVNYLFDQAKTQMIRALTEGELKDFLKEK